MKIPLPRIITQLGKLYHQSDNTITFTFPLGIVTVPMNSKTLDHGKHKTLGNDYQEKD